MVSEVNEVVPLDAGQIYVLDIDRDYIYSAFAKQAAKKHAKGEAWTFNDFTRQALLTYAAAVR